MQGYQTTRANFKSNPVPHMIVIADAKAKESRIRNKNNPSKTNIKYYSKYSLKLNDMIISRAINKTT